MYNTDLFTGHTDGRALLDDAGLHHDARHDRVPRVEHELRQDLRTEEFL